ACAVALCGVSNWLGKVNGKSQPSRALADLDYLNLHGGRQVFLAFDSDAQHNENVQRAEAKLAAELTKRGASVWIVRVPPGPGGAAQGADDYFAEGPRRTLGGREQRAERFEPRTAAAPPAWPEPLGKAAYTGLAGEIVHAIAPHTESDPAAVLLQFLAQLGI